MLYIVNFDVPGKYDIVKNVTLEFSCSVILIVNVSYQILFNPLTGTNSSIICQIIL